MNYKKSLVSLSIVGALAAPLTIKKPKKQTENKGVNFVYTQEPEHKPLFNNQKPPAIDVKA